MQKNTLTYLLASLLVIPGFLVGGVAWASIVSGNLTTLPNSIVAPPVTPVVPPITPTTTIAPITPTTSTTTSTGGGGASVVTNSTTVSGPTWILGDINKSGKVDEYDLAIMMSQWGGAGTQSADLNKDNKVDVYDFSLLMANWGR